MKEDVAADAGMPDQVALFFGEVDGEEEAIGGDAGSGEPSRGDLALLALAIDPHAHVGKMLHSTAGFKLPSICDAEKPPLKRRLPKRSLVRKSTAASRAQDLQKRLRGDDRDALM